MTIRLAASAVAAVIACAGQVRECRGQSNGGSVLKIGLLLPPEETQARSIREGALLAQELAPKLATGRVEVVIRGRVGQWGADAEEAARMATDDAVAGLITPPDGAASHLVLQVSGRTAVPVVSLCADSSVSRTGVPWMLRVVPRTADELQALVDGISKSGAAESYRWAALVPDGRAGREIGRDLKAAAAARRIYLDTILELNKALTSVDTVLAPQGGARPDVVLLWLPPGAAGKMARNFRIAGYRGILAGPAWLNSPDFFSTAGDAASGVVVPAIAQRGGGPARWRSFRAAYMARWGRLPDWMAAMSYDATMLLVQLLKREDFQAPPHRLPTGFSWPGATGDLSFDVEGNRRVKLLLLQGQGKDFIPRSETP